MSKILISHRGNISGPDHKLENQPSYLMEALNQGYQVEIDVWYVDDTYWLGHDAPQYQVEESFLSLPFWCHAKNVDALNMMLNNTKIHCFWHQTDDVTLTSFNYLWTFPGRELASVGAIAVVPERVEGWDISKAAGICSDYIERYR